MLKVMEHKSSSYSPRTYHNASQGCTLAIAVDFKTAGERLTHKAANDKIVQIPFHMDYVQVAREVYKMLKKYDCHVLNVAGNGIYTLSKHGVNQEDINVYIYSIVSLVHEHWTIEKIVSGGQTGADLAGAAVGVALSIPTEVMYPKGFKVRTEDGVDREWSKEYIEQLIFDMGAYLGG